MRTPLQRQTLLIAGTAATFVVTWIYRWLTVDFPNDHFVHLSRARQILLGELPFRDFFDAGLPLHYYASAAALALSGHNLLGEAILTVSLTAIGTAMTFYLAARGSRSLAVGTAAALIVFAVFPRLYNYPKVFLYPLALLCIYHYARRRSTAALGAMAAVTAVAFLFRHDHGFYIGLSSAVAIVLANLDRLRAAPWLLLRFGAIAGVLVLPFLIFVQLSGGIVSYFSGAAPQRQTATTLRLLRLPFDAEGDPWITINPPSHPRIAIRWKPGITDAERSDRERRYQLTEPAGESSYVLADTSTANIRALVNDPLVEDTHNIDRSNFRPSYRETWLQRAANAIPLLRLRIGPHVLTNANAVPWLYYVTTAVPFAALLVMLIAWRRGHADAFDLATLGAAIVMCFVIDQGLIRDQPEPRLADVIAPAVILAAWTTGMAFRSAPRRQRSWLRIASACGVAAIWLITLGSAAVLGEAGQRLAGYGMLSSPSVMAGRLREVTRVLMLRPIDWYAPPGSTGLYALTRYVLDCTQPSDRVLVTWFDPQVFFYAERPFAGGQAYFEPEWHSSAADQALTIARMQQQHVPIVLVNGSAERQFHKSFPRVDEYVHHRYREAARSTFGGDREYAVFVDRELQPARLYEPLKLPCFR